MLKLAVIEGLVDRVHRKEVDQKPSSEPQPKKGAVQVGVESASESEWPHKQKIQIIIFLLPIFNIHNNIVEHLNIFAFGHVLTCYKLLVLQLGPFLSNELV